MGCDSVSQVCESAETSALSTQWSLSVLRRGMVTGDVMEDRIMGYFSALSYLALTESQSNTSLASCFLCFWMLGISTCKEEHTNTPCGMSSRIFSLTFETVIFIYKFFFSLGKGFCTLRLLPLYPKRRKHIKSTDY